MSVSWGNNFPYLIMFVLKYSNDWKLEDKKQRR